MDFFAKGLTGILHHSWKLGKITLSELKTSDRIKIICAHSTIGILESNSTVLSLIPLEQCIPHNSTIFLIIIPGIKAEERGVKILFLLSI